MKALIKPTEPFMLLLDRFEVMHSHRPSIVTYSDYLQSYVIKGKIKVLEKDLPEEALDKNFEKFYRDSDGNQDLAVASYMSSLKPKAPEPTEAEKKAAAAAAALALEEEEKKKAKK